MCGISGFIDTTTADAAGILKCMTQSLSHRGPDDEGCQIFQVNGSQVGLGHRRLSIIDISMLGHQPMTSASHQYHLVFNGEIYNFIELRGQLDKHSYKFKSRSDTEVLLAGFEIWGIKKTLQKAVGMFALALWDQKESRLYLARDRMGEKPLYYGWQKNTFLFASELKALKHHPDFSGCINSDHLSVFLRHGYIPAPYSIYKDIEKLEPGMIFCIDLEEARQKGISAKRTQTKFSYWSVKKSWEHGRRSPFSGNLDEATDKLETLFANSIKNQMISDVPLGAFLSGGIDSSLVVSLMQAFGNMKVKTFTIGFHEQEYDEARYAKEIAKYLGTDHTEIYISSKDALDVIPELPKIYDEPFADVSQIPTYLIAKLTHDHVTVAISGDGGDELFGGYKRYTFGEDVWTRISRFPPGMRSLAFGMLKKVPYFFLCAIDSIFQPLFQRYGSKGTASDKFLKAFEFLDAANEMQFYENFVSAFKRDDRIVLNSHEVSTIFNTPEEWPKLPSFVQRMMAVDLITYLPGDILTKIDRASMAVSLETRMPMLDHRIVEFVLSLPLSFKRQNGKDKIILHRLLNRYVPNQLVDRPKMGFGVPVGLWLRGPLFDWANELLNKKKLTEDGFLDSSGIIRKWNEHISGERDWSTHMWHVLMFQAWLSESHKG